VSIKHVFNVLMCAHKWSEPKKQKVRTPKHKKPRDAEVSECSECGTVRVQLPSGIAEMYPRQGKGETNGR
jgi:hypothetical protein